MEPAWCHMKHDIVIYCIHIYIYIYIYIHCTYRLVLAWALCIWHLPGHGASADANPKVESGDGGAVSWLCNKTTAKWKKKKFKKKGSNFSTGTFFAELVFFELLHQTWRSCLRWEPSLIRLQLRHINCWEVHRADLSVQLFEPFWYQELSQLPFFGCLPWLVTAIKFQADISLSIFKGSKVQWLLASVD